MISSAPERRDQSERRQHRRRRRSIDRWTVLVFRISRVLVGAALYASTRTILIFQFLGLVLRMMSAIHSSVVRSVSTCTAVLGITTVIPRTTGCQTFAKCLYRRCDGDRIHLSCCMTISMNAPTPWDAVVAGGALEVAALGSGCKRVGTAHARAWMRASDCICADNNQV